VTAAVATATSREGTLRFPYLYQYCEKIPDPRVLTTAARLA